MTKAVWVLDFYSHKEMQTDNTIIEPALEVFGHGDVRWTIVSKEREEREGKVNTVGDAVNIVLKIFEENQALVDVSSILIFDGHSSPLIIAGVMFEAGRFFSETPAIYIHRALKLADDGVVVKGLWSIPRMIVEESEHDTGDISPEDGKPKE